MSDTLNNLLMQKLKGLSVSLGGREESTVAYNGADIKKTGICPLLKATESQRRRGIDMSSLLRY